MAASPSSLSSSTPSTTTSLLYHSSSHFKGNVSTLKAKPRTFPSIKLSHYKSKQRHPLVVLNSAASGVQEYNLSSQNVRFRLDNLCPGRKLREKGEGTRLGRGAAAGTHAGLPKYVPLNLKDIADAWFKGGEEVSLESLKMKGLISPSGRDRGLPLTILGNVELRVKLNFKTRAFSESAKEKLKAAGRSLTILPGQKKWVKPSGAENIARAEEYFAKKRASSESDDSPST
ncbi:UNVERIFIED_CONTAM: 50S ribosomal protein L15, chloroplastic [Sesamum calycinum]|uniref:50S ribosomal protein L15, chloroplastic n=1 Tax=Sesamum calycinum TaxID=2727403 RepID=A0AAW2SVW1_9LAMI